MQGGLNLFYLITLMFSPLRRWNKVKCPLGNHGPITARLWSGLCSSDVSTGGKAMSSVLSAGGGRSSGGHPSKQRGCSQTPKQQRQGESGITCPNSLCFDWMKGTGYNQAFHLLFTKLSFAYMHSSVISACYRRTFNTKYVFKNLFFKK